jgi:RNA polymerase sigma-70 factor (ECF subfamily)
MDPVTDQIPCAPTAPPTDHSLLRRLRSGNQDAATQLYLRYAQRLHQLAQAQTGADLAPRLDAEDVVQSVFSSFFRGVRQGFYDVPPGEELWKLLLVIALNKIRAQGNFHRAACRDVRRTSPETALAGSMPPQASEVAHTTLRLVIEECLEVLPQEHRRAITWRIEGHEVADIARGLGRSRRTVERILQDFRRRLAQVLDREL